MRRMLNLLSSLPRHCDITLPRHCDTTTLLGTFDGDEMGDWVELMMMPLLVVFRPDAVDLIFGGPVQVTHTHDTHDTHVDAPRHVMVAVHSLHSVHLSTSHRRRARAQVHCTHIVTSQ